MILTTITLLASAWLIFSLGYFGAKLPAYRHIKNTISELGEVGSPFEKVVGFGVFLPVGLLLLVISMVPYIQGLQNNVNLALCGVSACVGVGYTVAAFFPCDPGSPLSGTTRQQIHNFGGVIEYIGGAYFLIGASLPFISIIGYLIISGSVAMSFSGYSAWRGLIQRIVELGLFVCLFLLTLK